MRKFVILAIVLLAALAASAWAGYSYWLKSPVYDGQEALIFEVARGASMTRVASQLSEQTGYPYARFLSFHAQQKGLANRLKAGEYEILPGLTPDEFLAVLTSGKVVNYPLTVIEGWTFEQMREAVAAHPVLEHTVSTAEEIMEAIGHPGLHPEGRFYPDTYLVTRGQTDVEVYRRAFETMTRLLDETWAQRDSGLPFNTPYEALIMASIIERETGSEDERRQISGVFSRRLHIGMRLQTDPTVIYGVGDAYQGDITRKHLTTDTPYNTYTRGGLPPTPIALPGKASLVAAVSPDSGTALYFVATGDGNGGHYFSDTLAEHNKALQRYLKRLRQKP